MKSFSTYFKNGILFASSFMAFIFQEAHAQATIPVAQSLPYTQDFSALAWASSTYPAGWQGWSLDNVTGSTVSFRTTAPVSDKPLTASSDASTATGGICNFNGKIGILAQNNGSKIDPALALSISTTGQSNVKVVFDVMTIRNPFGGSQSHINNVELQYRIGSSTGPFSSLSGSIYANNTTNQSAAGVTTPQKLVHVTVNLPAICENQGVVQLRWVQRDSIGSGTNRPSFAFDNISICGTPSITPSGATTFCSGNSVTLTASAGSSYLWSSGATTQSIIVSSSGSYSVAVTQAGGCSNTSPSTSVTVQALPNVSATSATVCAGAAATIMASGAVSYLWNTGEATASLKAKPSSTTTYTVTGTGSNGCTNTAEGTITVNSLPNVTVSSVTVCAGASGTITAGGATSYAWNTGITTAELTESPSSTTVYTVTGTDNNGCVNEAAGAININPLPVITATSASVCTGSSVTISAGGASVYSWSNGASGSSIQVSPSGTTTYTVSGTDANLCTNSATALVTVYSLPVVTALSDPGSSIVCSGTSVALSGSGASTYLWSGGITNGVAFAAETSTAYTVTGTDANGCKNQATIAITVNDCRASVVTCGRSFNTLNSYLTCTAVGGAANYCFKFYDSTGTNLVTTKTQPSNYIYFDQVGGLHYGNIYYWTVEVGYDIGSDTIYSTPSSSGCPITFNAPQTVVPCGRSYTTLNSYLTCTAVTGAVNYRFKFYDSTGTNLVTTKTQPSNYIYFSQVGDLHYGNTYYWTVEVEYNTGNGTAFGPASSSGCPIIFTAPQTIVPCGRSYATLNSYLTCTAVTGAVNYRFKFYDNTGTNLVTTKTQPSNYIYFSQVGGLHYGNTYYWTVEVEYNTGNGTAFGPASSSGCPITFTAPQTVVPCDRSYTTLNSYLTCTAISGATMYKFTFYSPGTTNVVACKTQTSNYIYFNQVPGLQNNSSYYWSVAVQYFDGSTCVFGPESVPCSLTFGTPYAGKPGVATSEESGSNIQNEIEKDNASELNVVMFPNPNKGNFSIEVNKDVKINVYNSIGEKIYSEAMLAGTKQFSLEELGAGIYLIQVDNGITRKQIRMVKE